jgi:hypothetical protein
MGRLERAGRSQHGPTLDLMDLDARQVDGHAHSGDGLLDATAVGMERARPRLQVLRRNRDRIARAQRSGNQCARGDCSDARQRKHAVQRQPERGALVAGRCVGGHASKCLHKGVQALAGFGRHGHERGILERR